MDGCLSLVAVLGLLLSIIALARSSPTESLRRRVEELEDKVQDLLKRLQRAERALKEHGGTTAPSPEAAKAPDPPLRPESTLAQEPVLRPLPLPEPVLPAAPPPSRPQAAAPALPPPIPVPVTVPAPAPVTVPAPVPKVVPPPTPPPQPKPREALPAPETKPAPVPPPAVVPPQIPPPIHVQEASKPSFSLEDFLGTQLFLKLGVAVLVIGVVFAMGLVFQRQGPLGKVLMGYLGGVCLLGLGLWAERKETYRTFGRALIAGGWAIVYFVTFAAGFIDAAKVITSPAGSTLALFVAAAAAVGYTLRYRHEWTTTSAYLLIYLSLVVAAMEVQPRFNLLATVLVATSVALLSWRLRWVRLLALGLTATWVTLAAWTLSRPDLETIPATLGGVALCWVILQAALLLGSRDEAQARWIVAPQLANFLLPLGVSLQLARIYGAPWIWTVALAYGLAHLAVAWVFARQGRRIHYLLSATEGLAALALVTPLRLGLAHHLTPVYRLVGLEVLLAAGVFLRERYFRHVAFWGLLLTLADLLLLRVPGLSGAPRHLLLGAPALVMLLNAGLFRTLWREALEAEGPGWAMVSGLGGALCAALLAHSAVPASWLGSAWAALALAWTCLALRAGWREMLVLGPLQALLAALLQLDHLSGQNLETAPTLGVLGLLLLTYTATRTLPSRDQDTPIQGLRQTLGLDLPLLGFLRALGLALPLLVAGVACHRLLVPGYTVPILGLLALACLGLGLVLRHGEQVGGALGLLLFALASTFPRGWALPGSALGLPMPVVSLGTLVLMLVTAEAMARRGQREETPDWLLASVRWLGSLAAPVVLAALVLREASLPWAGPLLGALALAYLAWGQRRRAPEKVWLSAGLLFTALVACATHGWLAQGTAWGLSLRIWSLGLVALAALAVDLLARCGPRGDDNLQAILAVPRLLAEVMAPLLAGILVAWEAPVPWVAPGLALLAFGWTAAGLRWALEGKLWLALALVLATLLGSIAHGGHLGGHWLGLPSRVWSQGATALILFLVEVSVFRWGHRLGKDQAPETLRLVAGFLAPGILVRLVFRDMAALWAPPTLAALGLVYVFWARSRASRLHALLGLGAGLMGLVAILARAWEFPTPGWLVSGRFLSALVTVFLLYLLQDQLRRAEEDAGPESLNQRCGEGTLAAVSVGTLALCTLALVTVLWAEAKATGHTLYLAPIWALVGSLHLERGRALDAQAWRVLGHGALGLAFLAFLSLNLDPHPAQAPWERLATTLPFLGALAHVRLGWPRLMRPQTQGAGLYVYGGLVVVAGVCAQDLGRIHVLLAWALMALGALDWGLQRNLVAWTRGGSVLAALAVIRGLALNLGLPTSGLETLVLPASSLALLAGYLRLLKVRDTAEFLSGCHRMPWLAGAALLTLGTLWVEATGSHLTVWLAGFGLGLVVLGFFAQERAARLTGLGFLILCILKLFFYDLRGLSGLPRVFSFIALGVVLIVVSWAYTRFRARLERLL